MRYLPSNHLDVRHIAASRVFTSMVSRCVMFSERSESVHTTAELFSQTTQVVIPTPGASASATGPLRQSKCMVLSGVLLLVLVFEDKVPTYN